MKALIWRLFAALGALAAFIVVGCGPTEVHFSGEDSGYRSTTTTKHSDRDGGAAAATGQRLEHSQQKP